MTDIEIGKKLDKIISLSKKLKAILDSTTQNEYMIIDFAQIDSIESLSKDLSKLRKELLIEDSRKTFAIGFKKKEETITLYSYKNDEDDGVEGVLTLAPENDLSDDEYIILCCAESKDLIECEGGYMYCPANEY